MNKQTVRTKLLEASLKFNETTAVTETACGNIELTTFECIPNSWEDAPVFIHVGEGITHATRDGKTVSVVDAIRWARMLQGVAHIPVFKMKPIKAQKVYGCEHRYRRCGGK